MLIFAGGGILFPVSRGFALRAPAAFGSSGIDTILWGTKTYDMARHFQTKGVAGSGFDTRVKNYVFTQSVLQAPSGVEFVNEPIKAFAMRLAGGRGGKTCA